MVLSGTSSNFNGSQFQVNGSRLVAVGQNYTAPGPASGPLGSTAITLTNGTLVLAVASTTAAATLDMVSGNAVTLSGTLDTILAAADPGGSPAVSNGTIVLAGSNQIAIPANFTLCLGVSNGYSLNVGTVFSNSGSIIASTGNVSLAGSNLGVSVGTLGATGGGTLTMVGPFSTGTYAPAAGGTVVLSGAYSGSLASLVPAAGGTMVIANNTTAGTINVAGGAFFATNSSSFGPATLSLNGGTLGATTALTGGNALANPLIWGSGTPQINIGGSSKFAVSGSLSIGSTPLVTYTINDPAGLSTFSGSISGAGNLSFIGSPTLASVNSYSSSTFFNANSFPTITNNQAFGTSTLVFNGGGFQAGTPLSGGSSPTPG